MEGEQEKSTRDVVEVWTTAKGEIVGRVKIYVKEGESLLDSTTTESILNRQRDIWNGLRERFPSMKLGAE
jgi:hypothetical protein